MWTRPRNEPSASSPGEQPSPRPPVAPQARVALLGPSLHIKGTLSGKEDLLIEGTVEGEIRLHRHRVTIGSSGRVKADIYCKTVCVEGQVVGNLFGEEEVVIRRTGRVQGNATAPRVSLENGAKFRGSIDMQPQTETESAGGDKDAPAAEPARRAVPARARASEGDERRDGAARVAREARG